jgi:hypothetical protein
MFKFKDSYEMLYLCNGDYIPVTVVQSFPRSKPNEFLSVQNKENKEVLLIENVDSLDEECKGEIIKYLQFKNFSLEIKAIISIEEEYGLRSFFVDTKAGKRKFQTEAQSWPKTDGLGRVELEDISGDVFFIKNLNDLDQKSFILISDYVE